MQGVAAGCGKQDEHADHPVRRQYPAAGHHPVGQKDQADGRVAVQADALAEQEPGGQRAEHRQHAVDEHARMGRAHDAQTVKAEHGVGKADAEAEHQVAVQRMRPPGVAQGKRRDHQQGRPVAQQGDVRGFERGMDPVARQGDPARPDEDHGRGRQHGFECVHGRQHYPRLNPAASALSSPSRRRNKER